MPNAFRDSIAFKAQDFQDVVQIQTAFMQKQMAVFSEQAKTVAETCTKAFAGGMKPLCVPKTLSTLMDR
jgi:hypothetical protein